MTHDSLQRGRVSPDSGGRVALRIRRTLPIVAAALLAAVNSHASTGVNVYAICCGTTTDATFTHDCNNGWTLTVGAGAPIVVPAGTKTKTVSVTCPGDPCPSAIAWKMTAQAPCVPKVEGQFECVKCDQNGHIVVETGISRATIAANPEAVSVTLTFPSVVSYAETIDLSPCAQASPQLTDLQAHISFATHPDPNLISFTIDSFNETLQPFTVCGLSTGVTTGSIDLGVPHGGTIHKTTGQIIGTATTRLTNALTGGVPIVIPNAVTGTWPAVGGAVTLDFSGPVAARPLEIPAIGKWGLAILFLAILALGAGFIARRRHRAA